MILNVNNTNFSEVQGRRWNLSEVKNKSATINIDRANAPTDIYTIKFESTHLTGTGAVNFFSGSYVVRENHTLSIVGIARIRDDTLYEMEEFTEYEYIWHLQRVKNWYLLDGKLELHTYNEDGAGAILIFFPDRKNLTTEDAEGEEKKRGRG